MPRTSPRKDTFTIRRPDWRVGYKWTYRKTMPGSSTILAKEVIGEDTYRGTPAFVLRTGEEEELYGKEGLGFVASRKNGKVVSDVDKVHPFFSWPLEPAKESRASFTRRDLVENRNAKRDRLRFVSGLERVHAAAGDFDAVNIESYDNSTGRLLAQYWYSPRVKWFVKTRVYSDAGVTEEELMRVELETSEQRVN